MAMDAPHKLLDIHHLYWGTKLVFNGADVMKLRLFEIDFLFNCLLCKYLCSEQSPGPNHASGFSRMSTTAMSNTLCGSGWGIQDGEWPTSAMVGKAGALDDLTLG